MSLHAIIIIKKLYIILSFITTNNNNLKNFLFGELFLKIFGFCIRFASLLDTVNVYFFHVCPFDTRLRCPLKERSVKTLDPFDSM